MKCAALSADSLQQILHAGHRAVEEVAPDRMELARRTAISGLVADVVVELEERHASALEVAIPAGVLQDVDQLVARDRRIATDVLQHPLVRELDQGVAEVEDEPGDGHDSSR